MRGRGVLGSRIARLHGCVVGAGFRLCCQLFKKCVVHVVVVHRCCWSPCPEVFWSPCHVQCCRRVVSRGVLVTMPYPEVCLFVFAPRVLLCGSCCQYGSTATLTMGPPTRRHSCGFNNRAVVGSPVLSNILCGKCAHIQIVAVKFNVRIFNVLCGSCAHLQCVAFCIPMAHIQIVAVDVLR